MEHNDALIDAGRVRPAIESAYLPRCSRFPARARLLYLTGMSQPHNRGQLSPKVGCCSNLQNSLQQDDGTTELIVHSFRILSTMDLSISLTALSTLTIASPEGGQLLHPCRLHCCTRGPDVGIGARSQKTLCYLLLALFHCRLERSHSGIVP